MIHPRLLEVADEAIRANIPVRVRILDYSNPGLASGTVSALSKAGYRDGESFLEVDGFYKNGSVIIIRRSINCTEVFGRYDRLDYIGDENPNASAVLPYVNHLEYLRHKDRGFELSPMWIPLLLKHELIRAKTQTTYEAV